MKYRVRVHTAQEFEVRVETKSPDLAKKRASQMWYDGDNIYVDQIDYEPYVVSMEVMEDPDDTTDEFEEWP